MKQILSFLLSLDHGTTILPESDDECVEDSAITLVPSTSPPPSSLVEAREGDEKVTWAAWWEGIKIIPYYLR